MSVHRLKSNVAIRPGGQLDVDRLKDATRRRFARSGMNITEARVLARAVAGTLDEGKLGNADRVAFCRLRNGGLIAEDGVAVTGDVTLAPSP